jgi:hypothetical protein
LDFLHSWVPKFLCGVIFRTDGSARRPSESVVGMVNLWSTEQFPLFYLCDLTALELSVPNNTFFSSVAFPFAHAY